LAKASVKSSSTLAKRAKGESKAARSGEVPFIRQASLTTSHGGDKVTQDGQGCVFAVRRQRYQFLQAAERLKRPDAVRVFDFRLSRGG
jgi:hypothetical protein